MTSSNADDEDLGQQALLNGVKSAILNRLLIDLQENVVTATAGSLYTKSDSGVYGKYEKQDDLNEAVMGVIRTTLDSIVREYETSLNRDGAEGEKKDSSRLD